MHHPASWSPKQKSSAPLPNLSKDQAGRVAWQVLTRGTPLNHSCGRVAKLALERRRVQQRCPRGFSSAALGHRPQNRAKGADPRTGNLKGEKCFCPGVLSPPCPGPPVPGLSWFRVSGSPALPLRVPVCFCSATCFFLLAAGVAFQLPAGGTSGQAQGHRPKNRHRAPTQRPAFTGIPLRTSLLCSSSRLPCSSPSSLLLYFPKASPLSYFLTVAVLRWFSSCGYFCRDRGYMYCVLSTRRRAWSLFLRPMIPYSQFFSARLATFRDARWTCHTQCPST